MKFEKFEKIKKLFRLSADSRFLYKEMVPEQNWLFSMEENKNKFKNINKN